MACCSFACSRRTASSSCFTDWMPGVRLFAEAGKPWLVFPSRFVSRSRRSPSALGLMSSIPSVGVIMFISSYEFVAHSVHCQKETGLLRNWFEFLANPYNMSVHSPSRWKVLVTPDLVEQPVAAQRLPRMTQKMLQQLKFLA